jgi:hypothetical protein
VGYDPLAGRALPSGNSGGELEPSRPEVKVIRDWSSPHVVHTVGNALETSFRFGQALPGRLADARVLDLSARDEAPLVLCKLLDTGKGGGPGHYCTIPLIRGTLQCYASADTSFTPLQGGFCSMTSEGATGSGELPADLGNRVDHSPGPLGSRESWPRVRSRG